MTTPRQQSEDAAISAAVDALLFDRDESVSDLAYHTRISVASLYRKLGGQASWKAADLGAVARHFGVRPGDLFLGVGVTGQPGGSRTKAAVSAHDSAPHTHEYMSKQRDYRFSRNVTSDQALRQAA